MEYNTSQKKLILPEYGRHVHMMVQYVTRIKDREERNKAAHAVIGIMGNLQPHLRDIPDFKHKLWDHLLIISEFKLDIDAPFPQPSPGDLVERPHTVPYPQSHIRRKHYGKILVEMIREAGKMENAELKDSLVQLLAIQMKKTYAAWNRSDLAKEQVIQDLWDISDGKIELKLDMVQSLEPVVYPQHQVHGAKNKRKRTGSSRK